MDKIQISHLPSPHKPSDVVRVVGWWHGGNREYVDNYVLSGIGDTRPVNASYYYVGAYVTAKEGHLQSIGESRFDLKEITRGGDLVSQIRRPYSGSGGDGTMSIAAGSYPPLRSPIGQIQASSGFQNNKGNMTRLIDQYMSHVSAVDVNFM